MKLDLPHRLEFGFPGIPIIFSGDVGINRIQDRERQVRDRNE